MKRLILAGLAMAAILTGALTAHSLAQAEEAPMTAAHIARIKANCVQAQSLLNQLNNSDTLLRVNQGQQYELISSDLMAPLNSRVALNRLDGTKLVATTADYEAELNNFRLRYSQYGQALTDALHVKCTNEPVTFYDEVADARTKRQEVHDSVVRLNELLTEYRSDVSEFAGTIKGNTVDE